MTDHEAAFYAGLRAVVESSFPKRCSSCRRIFESADQFIEQTQSLNSGSSGLKASRGDDDKSLVEVYRNCPCGSTLMDFFGDRRDLSAAGIKRRNTFDQFMHYLGSLGMAEDLARRELLKVVHGGKSELLQNLAKPNS